MSVDQGNDIAESVSESVNEESSENMDSRPAPTESVAKKGDRGFHVDRTLIEEIKHDDQDAELQSLGLSVYNQETLEQGILSQVDQALEKHERDLEKIRLDKQLLSVEDNIRAVEQQLKQGDTFLRVMRGTPVTVTKAMTAKKEQENRREQLKVLMLKKNELTAKRAAVDGSVVDADSSDPEKVDGPEDETEQEKMIRLGEMTPFGTILPASPVKPSEEKLSGFEKYLQHQAALEKHRSKTSTSGTQRTTNTLSIIRSDSRLKKNSNSAKQKSALKPKVLAPAKRKRKESLGSKTRRMPRGTEAGFVESEKQSVWLDSDDPDFVPSGDDSDYFPDEKPSKTKPRQTPKRSRTSTRNAPDSESEWGSDDSDWQSSGDEEKIIRRRKAGKELDDGDDAAYGARIRLWEKEKAEDEEYDAGVHHLSDYLEVPNAIWNKLYKYQQVGVQWMWELYQNGTGGILGDEMGLGKTIQVIAFLAALKVSKLRNKHTQFRGLGASLIVCPTTVMHQWVREIHKWWPPLRVAILHDSGSYEGSRNQLIRHMARCGGILVTSYQGLVKHQTTLLTCSWHILVLDEGHKIRNPDAQATLAAKSIPTPNRLALTGSPMQNNLRELWSLVDFVHPSKLGTLPDFMANFAVPITQGGYANASEVQVATAYHCALSLKEIIKPYLLRRMKSDVKSHIQLPGKNEQVLFCKLTDEQRSLYRSYVDSKLVANIMEGRMKIFVGLINLRKICNHPDLFSGRSKLTMDDKSLPKEERYGYYGRSGKMQVIQSLLKIWHRQGHRVLLFTQGRQMMCILEHFLQREKYKYLKLDGTTSVASRQPLIAEFNKNPEHFVFLLTTRVGGLGVNLTGADRVVIFDPDWNPATDTQARERAWRIGQDKQVTIYRLVTAGTIEEKIYHRQIFKQFLTNKVLKDPRQRRFFKTNDLYELFTLKEGEEERSTETSAIFAGTGSEVYAPRKPRSKLPRAPSPQPVIPKKIEFSQEKINHMKLLAQQLSQKISNKLAAQKAGEDSENPRKEKTEKPVIIETNKTEEKGANTVLDIPASSYDSSKENFSLRTKLSKSSETSCSKSVKKHKKDKTKKRHKGAKFEGERVSHLAGSAEYSELLTKAGYGEEEERAEDQDDYVLRKLFKKKGLQTALMHDRIMESGGMDVALVEREAKNVAREAVERLRESQQQCFQASSGIPTWTGNRGGIRSGKKAEKRPAWSKKAKLTKEPPSAALGKAPESPEPQEEPGLISGDDLLALWSKKNRLLGGTSEAIILGPNSSDEDAPQFVAPPIPNIENILAESDEEEPMDEYGEEGDVDAPEPVFHAPVVHVVPPPEPQAKKDIFVAEEESDLLNDLRAFLSFGASEPCQATTSELLAKFPNDQLPTEMAPLFRCMLQSIADFYRDSEGVGIWRLKPEFR